VRTFPDTQASRDHSSPLGEWKPDVVFQPSTADVHQDHRRSREGLRRVQAHDDPRLRDPWNNFDFAYSGTSRSRTAHREEGVRARKVCVTAASPLRESETYGTSPARMDQVNREYARCSRCTGDRLVGVHRFALVLLVGSVASPVIPWLARAGEGNGAHPPLRCRVAPAIFRARLFLQAQQEHSSAASTCGTPPVACALLGRPQVRSREPRRRRSRGGSRGSRARTSPWMSLSTRWDRCARLLREVPPRSRSTGRTGAGRRPASSGSGLQIGSSVVVPLAQAPRCDVRRILRYSRSHRSRDRANAAAKLASAAHGRDRGPRPVLVKPGLHAFRVHRGALLSFR